MSKVDPKTIQKIRRVRAWLRSIILPGNKMPREAEIPFDVYELAKELELATGDDNSRDGHYYILGIRLAPTDPLDNIEVRVERDKYGKFTGVALTSDYAARTTGWSNQEAAASVAIQELRDHVRAHCR